MSILHRQIQRRSLFPRAIRFRFVGDDRASLQHGRGNTSQKTLCKDNKRAIDLPFTIQVIDMPSPS